MIICETCREIYVDPTSATYYCGDEEYADKAIEATSKIRDGAQFAPYAGPEDYIGGTCGCCGGYLAGTESYTVS